MRSLPLIALLLLAGCSAPAAPTLPVADTCQPARFDAASGETVHQLGCGTAPLLSQIAVILMKDGSMCRMDDVAKELRCMSKEERIARDEGRVLRAWNKYLEDQYAKAKP